MGAAAATVTAGLRAYLVALDFEVTETDAVSAANATLNEFMLANCGYTKAVATAADYEYTGLPTSTPAGPTSITLKNEGEEFHMVAVFRINDDVTASIEDILKLPDDEALTMLRFVTVTDAPAGESDTTFTNLKPGRYAAACFVSKDTSADGSVEGDGPPHFMEGMVEEFTVA